MICPLPCARSACGGVAKARGSSRESNRDRADADGAGGAGGTSAAIERFWCYVAGENGWKRLAPTLRERLAASADTLFGIELGTYERYLPDDETLAAIAAPFRLLVSNDGLPFFAEMTHRLGKRLDVDVAVTPGTHAAYHDHPRELAEAARPLLSELSAINT
jgi:hypothetical protein